MKKSINLGDIISLSGRQFESITLKQFTNHNSPKRQSTLSPWIRKSQQLFISPSQKDRKLQTHSFLSKIIFKKNNLEDTRYQQFTKQNNNSLNKQSQEQIILIPKTATISKEFSQKSDNHSIFISKKIYNNKISKTSAIVSLQFGQQKQEDHIINPQILFNTTKQKLLNPYQINCKKKQMMKFKLKHNNKLNSLREKQRQLSLQQYLKSITEHSSKNTLMKHQKNQENSFLTTKFNVKKRQSMSMRFSHYNSRDVPQIFCEGQVIDNVKSNKSHRIKTTKMNYTNHVSS